VRVPASRGLPQSSGDDLLDLVVADKPGPAGPRLVRQPLQPFPQEPAPPLRHHVPGNAQFSGYGADRPALGAGQDDPRPLSQRLRGLPPPRPGSQRLPLVVGQLKGNQLGARHQPSLPTKAELLTQDTSSQLETEGHPPVPEMSEMDTPVTKYDASGNKQYDTWAEYFADKAAHRERVEVRMANAPAMQFSDENFWSTATATGHGISYREAILAYAERWARLMQLELTEGKALKQVWLEVSHEADLEGITGDVFTYAVSLLAQCWVHGERLQELYEDYLRRREQAEP
jgi:hypothetical protein